MLDFVTNYGGSIIVGLVVLAIVVLIIIKGVRDKRAGKHSCSCGSDCASCGMCRPKNPRNSREI